jgi:hypothetical protein
MGVSAVLLASAALGGQLAWGQDEEFNGLLEVPLGPPPVTQPAEQAAPIDLTGYWTSVVTEDWRWRMLTPPKGDYASIPLSPAGKKLADQFNPALYGGVDYQTSQIIDCRAYGAAGLMRMPTRLHISWENPNELKLESDWGEQTRRIYFDQAQLPTAPSLQGSSLGSWQYPPPVGVGFGFFPLPPRGKPTQGKLKVMTGRLAGGWLRRNGVPYSDRTRMTEYFQAFKDALGRRWFDVTTVVVDPTYLINPLVTSSDFRQEPDGAKWSPHPCKQL